MWPERGRVAAPRALPTSEGLSLYLRCHEHVLALETRWIERLLLADEAEPVAKGTPAIWRVGSERRAVWNLGEVFKLAPALGSLVLLDARALGLGEGAPALALAAGPCLKVAPAPPLTALPPGLFRTRRAVVRGAFAAHAVVGGGLPGATVGLALDPRELLGNLEVDAARQALAREAAR